jgi:hypothetical protein
MSEETRVWWGAVGIVMGAVVAAMVWERGGGTGKVGRKNAVREVATEVMPKWADGHATTASVERRTDARGSTESRAVTTLAAPAASTRGAMGTLVKAGDETIGLERRMKKMEMPGGVYVTYDDFWEEWRFKEGTGKAAKRTRPPGVLMGKRL